MLNKCWCWFCRNPCAKNFAKAELNESNLPRKAIATLRFFHRASLKPVRQRISTPSSLKYRFASASHSILSNFEKESLPKSIQFGD
jgi:hypothetical protein